MSKSSEEKATIVDGDTVPFNLTDVDRATLAQTDDEFIPHSWKELQEIVSMFLCHQIVCRLLFHKKRMSRSRRKFN